ncbi:MAG: amino acid deaminase/aldolase [Aeromicrobium sp.]
MAPHYQHLLEATGSLGTPLAVVDADALWANADDLARRAHGVPIRVASKSVRVRSVIERTLELEAFAGVMSYSLAESNWLVDHGAPDVLLAYPTVDAAALRDLVDDERRTAAITLMIDSIEALDVIDSMLDISRPEIRVCLDVDASLRIGPVHLGVRRSPVHTVDEATRIAQMISGRAGFRLVGLMFYDAQIAGLPDSSAGVRLVKKRSAAELTERRGQIVKAVRHVAPLEIVNAGGTGSLEVTGADPAITELTAGSGLFAPSLFDGYDAFKARPAAFFALSVVRRPAADIATVFSGGYIASGATHKNRRPTPVWPEGLALIDAEGAGEVQTPLKGAAARDLAVGDRVLMRHAKAGEMCERFDEVVLVAADGSVERLPTYRGEGKNFG